MNDEPLNALALDGADAPELLYVCRDFPGEHIGGPECFCHPTCVTLTETMTAAQINEIVRKDQRVN